MLEKVIIQMYCKYFAKVFLIAFSLVVTVIPVPSAFFAPAKPFNRLLSMYLEVVSLHILFNSCKDPYKCEISELLIVLISFEPRINTFFFTSALPTLLTMLRVL